jgi:hypothetical protein
MAGPNLLTRKILHTQAAQKAGLLDSYLATEPKVISETKPATSWGPMMRV